MQKIILLSVFSSVMLSIGANILFDNIAEDSTTITTNHTLVGYWGSWSPNTRDLEEILYFGEDGTACFDLTDYYRKSNNNIPNFEELQCSNRLISYKIIDKGVVMIEDRKATFNILSNDEIHFTMNGEKFNLFRMSKYQAIKES